MQFIPIRTHAVIDYVVAVLLVIAPFLFGFADGGPAMWTPIVLGLVLAGYSLLTRYPLSLSPVIPMTAHLWVDGAGGVLLLVSPWLFGFSEIIWWPHVLVGAAEIVVALLSERRSFSGQDSPEVAPRGP